MESIHCGEIVNQRLDELQPSEEHDISEMRKMTSSAPKKALRLTCKYGNSKVHQDGARMKARLTEGDGRCERGV